MVLSVSMTPAKADSIAEVDGLLQEYGAKTLSEVILDKRESRITVEVGGTLREAYGRPSYSLITPQSLLADMQKAHLTAETFASLAQQQRLKEEKSLAEIEANYNRNPVPSVTQSRPTPGEVIWRCHIQKEKGTLHRSSFAEWQRADFCNRLATTADYFVAISKATKPELLDVPIESYLKTVSTNALGLEKCISVAGAGPQGQGFKSAELATYCYLMMYP